MTEGLCADSRLPYSLPILRQREYDPTDPDPCRGCSDCCEYVAVSLDRPRTLNDFDEVLWFLLHQNVWVFVDDDNDWYVQFNTPCRELRDHRCGIYARRPRVCRGYEVESCTTYGEGDPHKWLLTCPDDFFNYLKTRRPRMHARLRALLAGRPCATPGRRAGRSIRVRLSGARGRRKSA